MKKKSFADMLKGLDRAREAKVQTKVPEWAGYPLSFPSSLSTEQCSSSATALYKASLVGKGLRIADLTGGLGVDLWAFSKREASALLYNDMNRDLAESVRSNYDVLSGGQGPLSATVFRSMEVAPGVVGEILDGFRPDVIFLDPARRGSGGQKVFRLQDCSPDLTVLYGELLEHAPVVMAKLSPMADITAVLSALGGKVAELHVVGAGGECKELVVILGREDVREPAIFVHDCSSPSGLKFTRREEDAAVPILLSDPENLPGKILFEPCAALLKSGCLSLLSERFGLEKIGVSTHLYVGESVPQDLLGLGKCFRIVSVKDFSSSAVKAIAREGLRAELSARGVPARTDELRSRMRLEPSDPSDPDGQRHLFVCGVSARGRALIIDSRRIS